jgi:hypothetical protein
MRYLIPTALLAAALYTANAFPFEVEGVKFDDSVTLPGTHAPLTLNGAGVRHKLVFSKLYVCALYLERKLKEAEGVFADTGAKRVAIHTLSDLTGAELVTSINHALEANLLPYELAMIEKRMHEFNHALGAIKVIRSGTVVNIDYVPGTGTHITVDGEERIVVPGADFYRGLLHVWIGATPVDGRLRDALLGAPSRLF